MTQATLAPMDARHLSELAELEDGYWWHVAKRQLAVQLLSRFAPPPGLLIEGGVGSSRNLLEFRQMGYDTIGLDVMPEAVDMARQRGVEGVQLHDLEDAWPVDSGSARVVVLLDVIEHLAEPVIALEHAWRALQPGGALVVTVPAAIAVRGWRRLFPKPGAAEFPRVSPFTNRSLLKCARVERWLIDHVPVPCGLSLAGVLVK